MKSPHDGTPSNDLQHYDLFRNAANVLASSIELDQALANTISVCLPDLADFGFFDVVIDGEVRRTARAFQDPPLEALLQGSKWQRSERTDINLCALSTGEAVLHENTDDAWYEVAFKAPRQLAFRSMLSVPVRFAGELLGSLTLFMAASGRNHNSSHLKLALEIADLAAPILLNARLIHRERQSQAALRHSEERLRLATEAGKIGIWEWTIADNKVTWSEQVYRLHGLAYGTFDGTLEAFESLIHPEDRSAVINNISKAIAHKKTHTDEFRVIRPDTSIRWLATSALIERDSSGQALRMLGSTRDITDEKTQSARLQNLNLKLTHQAVAIHSERDRIWSISQDMLVTAYLSGRLKSVNPAFTKMLGWSEQEALSRPLIEFFHPSQRDDVQQILLNSSEGIPLENLETRVLHKRGDYLWVCWTIIAEGEFLYAVGRDVTEARLKREHEDLISEKRFQLALTAGGMGAWRWDLLDGSVYWWPGMDKIHGLPEGSRIKSAIDYLEFVHPDDVSKLNVTQSDLLLPKTFVDVEYRIVWPDGSIHWIESRREQIFDHSGRPTQLAGICLDITERKLNEQNLQFLSEASAELADVVDHEKTLAKITRLAVPTFADWSTVDMLDESGQLARVSVSHVDPEKVKLAHVLHEKYPPNKEGPRGAWQILKTGKAELVEQIDETLLRQSIKDPEYLSIVQELGLRSYIGVPLTVRGKPVGVLTFISAESRRIYSKRDAAIAADIARRASIAIENSQLYRALREADRRKDDFLAMLAHELRNPLAPIRAAADLLNFPLPSDRIKKTAEIIARQVSHMTRLVDDLLDVSRVTRGQVKIDKKIVSIQKVVTLAIEQVRPQLTAKGHFLDLQYPEDVLHVDGDEARLTQVVSNLLGNALKFTPDGGKIAVSVAPLGELVEIRVRDNGIGMAPDLLKHAFDLFVQGERTIDRTQGGLGLGLALVKTLITLHGGTVLAISEGEGCGSEFILQIPVVNIAPAKTPVASLDQTSSDTTLRKILLVDDNRDAAETLADYLQVLGHDVTVTFHPKDALDKVEEISFDTIILDIGLPDMDGRQLAREILLRRGSKAPTLIALSGYGQPADRESALSAGIKHYLVKPVDLKTLLDLIGKE